MTVLPTSPSDSERLLAALARQHGPALLRHFVRKGFSGADAEDGVQEVMVRLARRADLLGEVARLDGYIFTIAQHVAVDFLRTSKRRRTAFHDAYDEAQHARLEHATDIVVEARDDLASVLLALKEAVGQAAVRARRSGLLSA